MTAPITASKLFRESFTKENLREIYTKFIADGASVGRDGVTLSLFATRLDQEFDLIVRKVKACSYEFTSYKEKLISKGAGKAPRQLSMPTIRDKLVLKCLAQLLAKVYPGHVSWVPHSTIKRVHQVSESRPLADFYLRLDIESYYPTINHRILFRILRQTIRSKPLLHLVKNAVQTPTGKQKTPENLAGCGVPQGLSISNILASIYLADIDTVLKEIPEIDYFRYVDDILMIGASEQITSLGNSVPAFLKKQRKITCHRVGDGGKSVKEPLVNGIEYLGYKFRLSEIEVRQSSLRKMFVNLMKIFTSIKHGKNLRKMLWRLNLRISGCQLNGRRIGWLFFFSQTKNMSQLKRLDLFVARYAEKYISPPERAKIKRFLKAYHEIKFNLDATRYFPNFDDFDDEQKKLEILILMPKKTKVELDVLSSQELNILFHRCVNYEIVELESDMMEVFS